MEAAVGSAEQAAQNQAETIQPQLVAAVTEHVQQARHPLRNGVAVAREAVSEKGTVYDQSHQVPPRVKVNLA